MTLYEMRLVTVLGFLGLGVLALVASLAVVHLRALAGRLKDGMTRPRALPDLRSDARDAARLVDHRQAAWRLRC